MNIEKVKEFEKDVISVKKKKNPTAAEIKELDKKEAQLVILKRKFGF